MFLASIFLAALAALANSLAAPAPPSIPNGSIPNPVCVVAAALTSCKCEPAKFRSMYDIVWSCVGTILLCTHISIHHNIPNRNQSSMRVMLMNLRTTLYALLAPELVIMWAMRQRMMAGKIAEDNKNRNWTKTHGFFLQMGGLMVEVEKGGRYEVVVRDPDNPSFLRCGIEPWKDEAIMIEKIPTISEAEIRDHGKGDFLAKAIVVIQTTWFVVQCIARHSQGLVITELELVTLAFAALNIVTYILWWDKPLNVCYPIYFDLDGKRVDGPSDFVDGGRWNMEWFGGIALSWSIGIASTGPGIWADIMKELNDIPHLFDNVMLRPLWYLIIGPFTVVSLPLLHLTNEVLSKRGTSVGPFYAARSDTKDVRYMLAYIFICVIGVVFGGIHLIGWNFTFTTQAELWLWRSSSLVLTVVPIFMALWRVFYYAYFKVPWDSTPRLIFYYLCLLCRRLTFYVGSPLYISARLIIIFLAFFSLRNLPDSAYRNVSWTDAIPHL